MSPYPVPLQASLLRCSINARIITWQCSSGSFCCNLDHSDFVYLMVRTQRTRPSQCISLYITSCSNIHLCFVLSSSLYAHPSASVRLHPWSRALRCHHHHLCLFQRDTCCRMLPLCRNAEFLCLLNFLTMLNYFIPALFCHIFTQPTLRLPPTPIVHVRPLHAGSQFFSPRSTCTRALNLQERRELFAVQLVSLYPCTFTIPTN
jgi:hypothetical protein